MLSEDEKHMIERVSEIPEQEAHNGMTAIRSTTKPLPLCDTPKFNRYVFQTAMLLISNINGNGDMLAAQGREPVLARKRRNFESK